MNSLLWFFWGGFSRFLDEVQAHSSINKMSVQNLATVFGPNILRPKMEDPVTMMEGRCCHGGMAQQLWFGAVSESHTFLGSCISCLHSQNKWSHLFHQGLWGVFQLASYPTHHWLGVSLLSTLWRCLHALETLLNLLLKWKPSCFFRIVPKYQTAVI